MISIYLQVLHLLYGMFGVLGSNFDLHSNTELLEEAGCNPDGTLVVRGVCVNNNYPANKAPDQNITPIWSKGVSVQFFQQEVTNVKENHNRLILETQINLMWRDDRIITNSTLLGYDSIIPSFRGVSIPWYENVEWYETIWSPKAIYFEMVYDKKLTYTPATVLHVMPGEIFSQDFDPRMPATATLLFMTSHYTLGLKCSFDFSNFPFDKHTCRLRITNQFSREFNILLNKWLHNNQENEKRSSSKHLKDGFDISASFTEGKKSIMGSTAVHLNTS